MNLSINGQSQVPPGFRFHPTEEELLQYYLRKKVAYEKIDLDVIREVDLNKLEPWDIQEKCKIGSTPQNDWYFFSHKDRKYPTGTRTNRATLAGFWKATGRDKIIYSGFTRIGLRKTLVFYKGRAPHGQKSDWIMHEYRLEDAAATHDPYGPVAESNMQEEGWVVCRVFRKKNYQKGLGSPKTSMSLISSNTQLLGADDDHAGILDQILSYMGRTMACKMENDSFTKFNDVSEEMENNSHRFIHLPRLENNNSLPLPCSYQAMDDMFTETEPSSSDQCEAANEGSGSKWVALDRLVASQLNGQEQTSSKHDLSCFCDSSRINQISDINENDLWSFTKSSSDPLCHLPV